MDEDFRAGGNAGLFEQVQGGERAVHAFGAAGNDGPHFGVAGFVDKLVHRLFDTFVDHHDDVLDAVVVFECLDAPADDWLATHRHQLLGVVLVESGAESRCQHHGHDRHLLFLHLLSLTHMLQRKAAAACHPVPRRVLHAIRNSGHANHSNRTNRVACMTRMVIIRVRSAPACVLHAVFWRATRGDARTTTGFRACTGCGGSC